MAMLRSFIGKSLLSLLCVLALAGCEQKIDGSSSESFKTSVEKISKTLPEEEATRFRKSIAILTIKAMNLESLMSGKVTPDEFKKGVPKDLHTVFDGKTAKEVITLGEEYRAQQQAKRAAAKQRPSPLLPRPVSPVAPTTPAAAPVEAAPAAPQS